MLTSKYLHLNPSKALGPDRVSPKDLKLAQRSLIQGLFEVFKKSKDCCKFPQQWTESSVIPIFEKGIDWTLEIFDQYLCLVFQENYSRRSYASL